uniref:Uncharacterized protein n=1 Tax=viral metagenome TaxID=1070528 RepID=A0A6C0EYJ1_9ZZZZ
MAKSVKRISKKTKKSFRSKQRKTRVNKLRGGSTNPFNNNYVSPEQLDAMQRMELAQKEHLYKKQKYESTQIIGQHMLNQVKADSEKKQKEAIKMYQEYTNLQEQLKKIDLKIAENNAAFNKSINEHNTILNSNNNRTKKQKLTKIDQRQNERKLLIKIENELNNERVNLTKQIETLKTQINFK